VPQAGLAPTLTPRRLIPARAHLRPRLTNQDGTPTAWPAILGVVAPAIVVVSIITVGTIEH
jgi:hypothetical protein